MDQSTDPSKDAAKVKVDDDLKRYVQGVKETIRILSQV
jgi:hypothetical protein